MHESLKEIAKKPPVFPSLSLYQTRKAVDLRFLRQNLDISPAHFYILMHWQLNKSALEVVHKIHQGMFISTIISQIVQVHNLKANYNQISGIPSIK